MSLLAKHCGKKPKHEHHEWRERTETRWCPGVGR